MNSEKTFQIKFIRNERHFLLPTVKSIIIAQNIYDILFQYAISAEREEMLQAFLDKLEAHIKSKPRAPFSIPYTELEFLEGGLEELRLLNWIELDIAICEIILDGNEEDLEAALKGLENYIMLKHIDNTNTLYVYPSALTRY